MLPVASAIGNIHIGTIAGKLNGVMPAHTPNGWRTDQLSMPRPTCSVNSPFNRCGMPQANSTTSMPRVDLALGVGEDLAVLLGDEPRQRVVLALQQFEEFEQDARAGQRRGRGPGRETPRRRPRTARSTSLCLGKGDAAHLLAGRRVVDVAPAPARPLDPLAADIMLDVAHRMRPAR